MENKQCYVRSSKESSHEDETRTAALIKHDHLLDVKLQS